MSTSPLRVLVAGLLLSVLAIACYFPGLDAPYHFDSAVWLEGGRLLSGGTPAFVRVFEFALNSHAGPLGRPLAMLSFGLESWLAGGMRPEVSNSINLVLHLLNAALVFLLLSALVGRMAASAAAPGRGRALPLLATAIWLLHPLQASTVLYTVQRMSILAATFSLIAILLYTRLRERLANGAVPALTVSWLITGIASCTVLGILAKESAVLLPWFLVLVEVCFFGYVVAGRPCSVLRWSSRLMVLLPVGLAAGLVLLFPHVFDSWYQPREFTVQERLLSEARILWRYLGWIYWPASPEIGFHHDDIAVSRGPFEPWTGALAVGAWLAVIAGAWRMRARAPWIAFAAGWYLVAHALESTIVPLELVFEHRNYLALLGPLLLVPGLAMTIEPSSATRQRLRLLAWLAVVFCAGLLAVRASYWGDESAFAARELRNHPRSARALFHYANTALREGESTSDPQTQKARIVEARQHYELLLEREPAGLVAPATLLYIDSRYFPGLGATSRWMELIEEALGRPKPTASDLNALHMLVDCLNTDACAVDGGWAATLLERAADRAFGGGPFAHYQAARYFMGAGRDGDRARQHLRAATALQPSFVDAYALLAQLHAGRGERAEAVAALAAMMRADPHRVRLASVLGMLE